MFHQLLQMRRNKLGQLWLQLNRITQLGPGFGVPHRWPVQQGFPLLFVWFFSNHVPLKGQCAKACAASDPHFIVAAANDLQIATVSALAPDCTLYSVFIYGRFVGS